MKLKPEFEHTPTSAAVERWLAKENMQLGEYLESEGMEPTEAEKQILDRERIIRQYR